jgi:PTH1 family peptidyl-tRNA hydrolase
MKIIVGLGNIGKEYEKTRHNVGFMFLDFYLGQVMFKEKKLGLYYEKNVNGEKVIFLKPTTYMNDSGLAIRSFLDYYKIDIEDLLVIYDDMDFDVGSFKIKKSGSAAGHNGIKSIIRHLGTENFKRIRIGISREKRDKINYVLGNFSKSDQEILNSEFELLNKVLDDYFVLDFEKLMSKYNM